MLLLCLLIICFRNHKSILLFLSVTTIIYLIIQFINMKQSGQESKAQAEREYMENQNVKTLLRSTFDQWQEIDGPSAFLKHPVLIHVYYHLCELAQNDATMRESVRSSIKAAERYLQTPDEKAQREALYNCIKELDIFIDDPTYVENVILIHDYLQSATVPPQ